MKEEEIIEKIAFAYYYQDHLSEFELYHSEKELKSALKLWNQMKSGLVEGNWKDGKHYGDCINVPMSCIRCQYEERYNVAKDIMNIEYKKFLKEDKNE